MFAVIKLGNPMRLYTMIKLRMATGLSLLLFMATMIGGPVRMSQARANDGGVTLASLAGKFETRTSGSLTLCYNESFTEAVDCASALHQEVHFKVTSVGHGTRDAAGNACGVTSVSSTLTGTAVAVYAAKFPTRLNVQRTNVSTTTSFDPTTGSGTATFRQYREKSCIGAGFDITGAVLAATGTLSFMVSDSGNRIETILTSISYVPSSFSIAGSMKETVAKATSIRQSD
jgi:hypothetical protein